MTTSWPAPSRLLAGALCFFCSVAASGAHAQGPARLYGVIDVDFVGHDIAFSVELGGDHAVTYYGWGRDLDEIERLAIDRKGELYLFAESAGARGSRRWAAAGPNVSVRGSRVTSCLPLAS